MKLFKKRTEQSSRLEVDSQDEIEAADALRIARDASKALMEQRREAQINYLENVPGPVADEDEYQRITAEIPVIDKTSSSK